MSEARRPRPRAAAEPVRKAATPAATRGRATASQAGLRYSTANPMPLEGTVPYRLAVAANLNAGLWQRNRTRRHGLTGTDWRILMLLVTRPGLAARELAETLAIDKMSVTRSVQRLLAGRYIQVARNPDDRRRLALTVAPRGAAIYDEIVPALPTHESRLFRDFSDAERLMLTELLGKLVTVLRQITAELDAGKNAR